MSRASSALLLMSMLAAAPAHAQWLSRTVDGIMGTRIYVEIWADDQAKGEAAIDAVMDEMRHIDDTMSTYKPSSEVSRVNALAARQPVPISLELFKLLGTALEYSRITEGAFDITYASVGYMYDFREHKKPTESQIEAALPAVSFRHVLLDARTHSVRFSQPGVRIDLGGIAKGYSVDRGIEILQARGYTHALVNALFAPCRVSELTDGTRVRRRTIGPGRWRHPHGRRGRSNQDGGRAVLRSRSSGCEIPIRQSRRADFDRHWHILNRFG